MDLKNTNIFIWILEPKIKHWKCVQYGTIKPCAVEQLCWDYILIQGDKSGAHPVHRPANSDQQTSRVPGSDDVGTPPCIQSFPEMFMKHSLSQTTKDFFANPLAGCEMSFSHQQSTGLRLRNKNPWKSTTNQLFRLTNVNP